MKTKIVATQQYGLYLLAAVIAGFLVFARLMRDQIRRKRWHEIILNMPGLGRWTRMANIADWSRSLGVLLNNGVPALAALKISSAVVSNLHLRSKMEAVTESMRRGSSLQKALEEQQVGSGFLIHMVGSGEASSELDKMLMRPPCTTWHAESGAGGMPGSSQDMKLRGVVVKTEI